MVPQVEALYSGTVQEWRYTRDDPQAATARMLDDSSWQAVSPGFVWEGENTKVWFRTRITIPAMIGGQSVAGRTVRLDVGVDDDGELYVDGRLREAFHWDDCRYTLTPDAKPGETFQVTVHGINGPGTGQLRHANLVVEVLPELQRFVEEAGFLTGLETRLTGTEKARVADALAAAEGEIKFTTMNRANTDDARKQLMAALEDLKAVASIGKRADVYYVGHAHIDMNWLWTWPETIDVCQRTWTSATNLMLQFPDFCFVQSQPGAYAPIEEGFPDLFSRMKEMQKRGQWDLVGGLWNESDTDMPSGEGLARSMLLGQSFFKSRFGSYATTAWLPDSFGHSAQLPQLYRLAGMDSFYHMRCGNGLPFTWWEAPDGSRVLKASVDPYSANVELGQLLTPWDEQRRTGLNENLVVFGVGDHGGGPTREQILTLERFKQDPVLPRVHTVSADSFFKQLAARPQAAELPVVDTDLQYIFEGCYTTRADLKKALRDSENGLYTAEALSSLASAVGAPYPANDFIAAWKPTAFAQFHDIMCGSAIHSTYEWMLAQMRPAIQTEKTRAGSALDALAAAVDTRGPSPQAIVVWNTLSFARDDVVRVHLEGADRYKSVVDASGVRLAAQADGADTLVFVARKVPGFGHAVYFPSAEPAPADGLQVAESDTEDVLDTPRLRVRVDKATGAIAELGLKAARWNAFGLSGDGGTFQLLGDRGDAWTFNYTGQDRRLSTADARVSLEASGPVFARVRVERAEGNSTYVQDVTVYGALDRVDVSTKVDWHEHGQTLKLRFPVDAVHPAARVEVPYGSVDRPTDGQECSGQKWMDVSDYAHNRVKNATTLDLSGALNNACAGDFDTVGAGYRASDLPAKGTHTYGLDRIPFMVYTGGQSGLDNASCVGQSIAVPAGAKGDTLYLLGSSAPSGTAGGVKLIYEDGAVACRSVQISDWVLANFHNDELAVQFAGKSSSEKGAGAPKLWIADVKVPAGRLKRIQLPYEPRMHVFAATLADKSAPTPLRGLSLLNDSKYGFDVSGGVLRLTALRSTSSPDTNPDEGEQVFTYSLYPHVGGWREARSEEHGLALNVPLEACAAGNHGAGKAVPTIEVENTGGAGSGDVVAGALKQSEDGKGYVLRLYETAGRDARVRIVFSRPVEAEEVDLLERPFHRDPVSVSGSAVSVEVGHDRIVSLRFAWK